MIQKLTENYKKSVGIKCQKKTKHQHLPKTLHLKRENGTAAKVAQSEKAVVKQPMMMAGREFLEKKTKKIRATICVELPYEHELLCYNDKLNTAILDKLKDGKFGCMVQTGYDLKSKIPVTK